MKIVEPKVYLLAEMKLNLMAGIGNWLNDLDGMECLSHCEGSDSERLIELAARRCYKSFKPGLNPNVTKIRKESALYHENILKSRHGSVLEHASSTWAFECVSRVFTHELVRHRQGTAFSQESLRYVRLTDLGFMLPKSIKENSEASKIFEETIVSLEKAQASLAKLFDIDNSSMNFETKKILTSAFRRIAPDGLATGIVCTMNMRALRWLIEHRTSRHAEEEIRIVFDKVADIAVDRWPMIFQDFKGEEYNGIREWVPTHSKV